MVKFFNQSKKVVSNDIGKLQKIRLKHEDPFELWESKGKVLPPTQVSAIPTKDNEIVVPHRDGSFKLYMDIYERVPVAKTAVDHTANFAVQSGFELEGNEQEKITVAEWMEEVDFLNFAIKTMKQMQIWGNAYYEKDGSKLLPPENMFVVLDKEKETIVGYKQAILLTRPTEFTVDEIAHFKWNDATTFFYGLSDFKAATATIQRIIQFQNDIGEIVHRYGNPIMHHKIGTPESPATNTQITDYISLQSTREVGEDLVTSSAVEVTPIVSNLRMIQPDGLVKQLEHQLIAGLQIPGLFVKGGETTNKATADTELQAFDRRVKTLRSVFSDVVHKEIFKKELNVDVKIMWNDLSVESEVQKSELLVNLVNSGVPLKTALDMSGWGSWVDDVEKSQKEDDKRKQDFMKTMKPHAPKDEPREDEFETQAEYFKAWELWKKTR